MGIKEIAKIKRRVKKGGRRDGGASERIGEGKKRAGPGKRGRTRSPWPEQKIIRVAKRKKAIASTEVRTRDLTLTKRAL